MDIKTIISSEEMTPFEKAISEAERLTKIARDAFQAIGRFTPGVERLVEEADSAWMVVDKMLGCKK